MIREHFKNIGLTVLLIANVFSCACASVKTMDNSSAPQTKSATKQENIIVSIPEMTSTAEIEAFKFTKESNPPRKDLLLKKLENYIAPLQKVDLVNLSNWAKTQMQDYKLPADFLTGTQVEQIYEAKDITVLKLKVADLPSHTPIVKRFLYLLPVYDSSTTEIKKIFITIEGHAEE